MNKNDLNALLKNMNNAIKSINDDTALPAFAKLAGISAVMSSTTHKIKKATLSKGELVVPGKSFEDIVNND